MRDLDGDLLNHITSYPWQWHVFYGTLIGLAYVSAWILISLFRAFV